MIKNNRFRIIIVSLAIVILGVSIYLIYPKDTALVKNFVEHWFSKSESNEAMYRELEKNVTNIGDDSEAETASVQIERSNKALKDTYGKYLTDLAFNDFIKHLTLSYTLEKNYENYKVTKVDVKKDANGYTFDAHLVLTKDSTEKNIVISGKVQIKDSKINWIYLTGSDDF